MGISKNSIASGMTVSMMFALGGPLLGACSELPSTMVDSSPVPDPIMGRLKIEMVGYFTAQTVSGVAVSRSGRLFVSVMQPGTSVSTSIGELNHGVIRPYSNVAWNSSSSGGGPTHKVPYVFGSVQAIEIDHHNHLWVLNCAADGRGGPRAEAAALVEINLNDNKAVRIISLDSMANVCAASINQLRFRSDDLVAYLGGVGKSESRLSINLQTQEWSRIPSMASPSLDHAVAMHCPNADLWMDTGGRFYTSARRGSSEAADQIGSRYRLLVEKDRMHWSTGLERGPDGAFYISAFQVCRPSSAQSDFPPSAVFRISSEMLNIVASAH